MNIVVAQSTGECSLHRTWTIWISFTILFVNDSLFAGLIWSWEITWLAGGLLRSHWVTSSICTGNVLWNDSGTQNNSHFRLYLSFMTQAAVRFSEDLVIKTVRTNERWIVVIAPQTRADNITGALHAYIFISSYKPAF